MRTGQLTGSRLLSMGSTIRTLKKEQESKTPLLKILSEALYNDSLIGMCHKWIRTHFNGYQAVDNQG